MYKNNRIWGRVRKSWFCSEESSTDEEMDRNKQRFGLWVQKKKIMEKSFLLFFFLIILNKCVKQSELQKKKKLKNQPLQSLNADIWWLELLSELYTEALHIVYREYNPAQWNPALSYTCPTLSPFTYWYNSTQVRTYLVLFVVRQNKTSLSKTWWFNFSVRPESSPISYTIRSKNPPFWLLRQVLINFSSLVLN